MIEILVAISIIALLAGLIAVGATVVQQAANENQAEALCQALLGAADEYRSKNAQGMNINHDGTLPVDWSGSFSPNAPDHLGDPPVGSGGLNSSERFVVACTRFDSSDKALRAAIQGERTLADTDNDGFLEIIDPWEKAVIYRSRNDGTGTGFDGVDNSLLPISRNPFFVSAGPDGELGTDDDIDSIDIGS